MVFVSLQIVYEVQCESDLVSFEKFRLEIIDFADWLAMSHDNFGFLGTAFSGQMSDIDGFTGIMDERCFKKES